jgi:hypothetical protein
VRVELTATGRHDFQKLQLVQNGKVIQSEASKLKDGAYTAKITREVRLDEPAWFAARIDSTTKNELGGILFAHTSPVYVDLDGKRVFDVETVRQLLKRLEQATEEIRARGKFGDDAARDKILAIYDETAKDLTKRISQRGK